MELSFKLVINSTREKVWGLYADEKKWLVWDNGLQDIQLDGDFKDGSIGKMQMKGLPPLEFKLNDVVNMQEFCNTSETPMGTIHFGHSIFEENGRLYIKHSVMLETEDVSDKSLKILENIFSGVPSSMLKLKGVVENG